MLNVGKEKRYQLPFLRGAKLPTFWEVGRVGRVGKENVGRGKYLLLHAILRVGRVGNVGGRKGMKMLVTGNGKRGVYVIPPFPYQQHKG